MKIGNIPAKVKLRGIFHIIKTVKVKSEYDKEEEEDIGKVLPAKQIRRNYLHTNYL